MAGKFMYISINDYSREDGSKFLEGRTHGCTCCSEEYPLTKDDLLAHIAQLEKEIKEAKALIKQFFK